MKLQVPLIGSRNACRRTARAGFTLTEILVAMAIFMLVVAGILSANLFGLRMFQINNTKLKATDWSRSTFDKISEEVRSCNTWSIGNSTNVVAAGATNTQFVGLLFGEPQQGNCLLIYPTTNNTSYILYTLNPADQTFRRTVVQTNGAMSTVTLADSVTNTIIFTAQDYSGDLLASNVSNYPVIHLLLQFNPPNQYLTDPFTYQLETAITPRTAPMEE